MYWLRPALLYLFVTALLCAGVWLFWGDAIKQKLTEADRSAEKQARPGSSAATNAKAPPDRKAKTNALTAGPGQAAVSGPQAWSQARSGLELLLRAASDENRRLLLQASAEQDRRFRSMLFKAAEQPPIRSAEPQPSAPPAR